MSPIALVAVVLIGAVAAFDRPARTPGNLTPIQLISALGAWALILANASAVAIAIRDGSGVLLCTATGTIAIAIVSMIRQSTAALPDRDAPQSLTLVVDDLKRLLGGAPRLGMASLDAVVVHGRCPGVGVAVARQGRVEVRVRRDVAEWLESHRRRGGAGAEVVASFARFIVLHEVAHVLNGDHRTFRFVRSVLIAQLVWLPGAAAAAAARGVDSGASGTPLAVAASIAFLLVAQSLVARKFIAERERWADWRAMQTLPPADSARLLERRGRRRNGRNPTELEKLMNDLKVHASSGGDAGLLARLIALVWPDGDAIHQRSERLEGDRAGGAPRPMLWAALTGMQCGFLSLSALMTVMLAIPPSMHLPPATVAMALVTWITAPAVTFCALRVDLARMAVRTLALTGRRVRVGGAFYLAFAAAALTLNGFQARFDAAPMPAVLLFALLLMVAMLVGLCVWASTVVGIRDGGGELRPTPRAAWVGMFPILAGMALVQVPLSVAAAQWVGAGSFRSGRWVPVVLLSFATFAVSSAMARSTSRVLRTAAPMALLDTPPPVYGFRVFWCNFYIDLSKTTLARAAAGAMAVQLATVPFFVLTAALMMQAALRGFGAERAITVAFVGAFGVMALILVIPDRYSAYGGPSARLLDTDRLRLFEDLLAAARAANPAAADRLNASFARWIRDDRFPDALLPHPEAVWPLAPLLSLVRLASATGESAAVGRWRGRIEHALRQIVVDDAVAVAPRQPPSLYWTVLAATIIEQANLRAAFPFEAMLDRIETLVEERLERGTANLVADLVAASQLLRRHRRASPDPQRVHELVRTSSLVSRPLLRQSLAELAELAELTGDAALRERLGPIVRSRMWEGLQLNPRKDVLLVLDCYLAAASLGQQDGRHDAAGLVVGELAERMSEELSAVVDRVQ
ncbi:MAG TPA: hypothetical protein VJ276_25550 [Thermoanaerobaculia bacterium]|nr:hypothetical protein [Thermoanaerobaculia bacterium]